MHNKHTQDDLSYYYLTAKDDSLCTEVLGLMRTMDKLRNNLYDEFKPQIKMLEELEINDQPAKIVYPFVATKKVTQVRIPPNASLQDNQPEILPIEQDIKEVIAPNLPPTGPLVKPTPEVDNVVYTMKSSLKSWTKAKVRIIIINVLTIYIEDRHARRERERDFTIN